MSSMQRLASNETQLVLESASMATGGKYSCEVSADAPSFHTLIAAAELDVVGKCVRACVVIIATSNSLLRHFPTHLLCWMGLFKWLGIENENILPGKLCNSLLRICLAKIYAKIIHSFFRFCCCC